jgi:hypothetical protein
MSARLRFTAISIAIVAVLAMSASSWAANPLGLKSLCDDCEYQLGVGETYHFWSTTGAAVVPLTVSWDQNRYELGIFRFAGRQAMPYPGSDFERAMADPYWGVSLSRRWQLVERGPVKAFFGFGLSYKTQSDELNATRVNFASQLGLRVRLPLRHVSSALELTMRHWSNAGIKLPNHGQDFATLTVRFDMS